jgi:hypothetical protein
MDDLPVLNAWDLRDGPRCGERLRRRLNGNPGQFLGGARHSVLARLRGDITLAHSEMRVPTGADFPAPLDLLPEQVRLHEAATRGYLALFSELPARALEWEGSRELPEYGVHFRMNPGIVLRCGDDTHQLRRIQASGRVPSIDQSLLYSLAILWQHNLSGITLQVVVADVVALEMQSVELSVDAIIGDAHAWFGNRVSELRSVAALGKTATGNECADCQYVWDCPAHKSARR